MSAFTVKEWWNLRTMQWQHWREYVSADMVEKVGKGFEPL
jgi:hypothetical protein